MSFAILALAASFLRQSFRLTALSDVVQCVLLLAGLACLVPCALRAQGRLRLFWSLMSLGLAFWLTYQLLWTYFEVWLRRDVPVLFAGDIVLFLHIVPFMAAIALRPHASPDEYASRLGRLDFALLMVCWIYLYVLMVIPWQYVVEDGLAYSHNLNSLYLVEKIALQLGLLMAWLGAGGRWRLVYANLFGASLAYAASSYVANWALSRNVYYSGSLYDIPLAGSMIWITLLAHWVNTHELDAGVNKTSKTYGVWMARLGMIAVFALPLLAAWALYDPAVPRRIATFRVVLTLTAALGMGTMVFARQRLLDRELMQLLRRSQDSFANLKRLQAEIIESEKLASLGQLVGGAAHELNNPITAMLGYSDLLLTTPLGPEQHVLAARIGQHIRRTKSLVGSLLSFARQGPPTRSALDLNALVRTALKLSRPQCQVLKIEIHSELQPDLPLVLGDSNQLLQVLVHLVGEALEGAGQDAGSISVATQSHGGVVSFTLAHRSGANSQNDDYPTTWSESSKPIENMGMSTCERILRDHQGRLIRLRKEDGTCLIRTEIPAIARDSKSVNSSAVPVLWQSRPFA